MPVFLSTRPQRRLALLALILMIAANAAACWMAMQPPWLGVALRAATDGPGVLARAHPDGPSRALIGEVLLLDLATYTGSNAIRLRADDLTTDADTFTGYRELDEFIARQAHLRTLLEQPLLMHWKAADGSLHQTLVSAGWRPLDSLPTRFWLRQAAASAIFLLGVWVALRHPRAWAPRMAAAAGTALFVAMTAGSLLSARELALSASSLHALMALNHAGATLFGCAAILALGRSPRPLFAKNTLWGAVSFFLLWLLASVARTAGDADWGYRIPLLIQGVIVVALLIAQWRARHRPAA